MHFWFLPRKDQQGQVAPAHVLRQVGLRCLRCVFALATPLEEILGFGIGAVVHDAGKTVALRIQDEVLAHYAKTNEAEVRLGHGLEDH